MNYMIDIETLRLKPVHKVPVISIGIVEFNGVGELTGDSFRVYLNQETAPPELETCPETIRWWIGQGHYGEITQRVMERGVHYHTALLEMAYWFGGREITSVWAAGPQFDIVVLENLLQLHGMDTPWNFQDVRDFRTIRKQYPKISERVPRMGPLHDEIADCEHQVSVLREIYRINAERGIQNPWR